MVRRSASLTTTLLRLVAAWFATIASFMAVAGPEDVVAKVKQSVVAIGTFQPARNPAFLFTGTGFVVGDGTLIATNAHVIPNVLDSERRENVVVALPSPTGGQAAVLPTQLAMFDREHDLALLSLQGRQLVPLSLGLSTVLREGQSVYFTGFPLGTVLGLIPATHRGIVSALTPIAIPRSTAGELDAAAIKRLSVGPTSVIQLDATAYPGNSGSPLYDETGSVVGIVNMVFVKGSRENVLSHPSGISYAVPVAPLAAMLASRKR